MFYYETKCMHSLAKAKQLLYTKFLWNMFSSLCNNLVNYYIDCKCLPNFLHKERAYKYIKVYKLKQCKLKKKKIEM